MRKVRCAAAALAVLCAGASEGASTDRAVRVFTTLPDPELSGQRRVITGDTLAAQLLHTILFIDQPCHLKIEGAEHMRRAWQMVGAYQIGCWYPTVDDMFVIIDGLGTARKINAYWESFPRAALHADGSATITEKNYDSAVFGRNVANEKLQKQLQRMNEKP